MTAVLLANVDYRRHMTNEGDQFQEGLRSVGWHLSGVGYDDVRDVPAILDRYRPARVVVHDKRDWDPCSKIAFRKDVGFRGVSALGQFGGFKAVVVKDAATFLAYHQVFYEEVGADAAIVYYHPESVERHAPWMRGLPLVRTYHSVDASTLPALERDRLRAVVSGARGKCYPLRELVFRAPERAGVDVLRHPGYGNTGTATPRYLETIGRYKVHVATASMFGFALRKIIESVAMGCTPVTDLPAYDVLPEIDGALMRVAPESSVDEIATAVQAAAATWDFDDRQAWADRARSFYDFRAIGARLDTALRLASQVAA